MAAPPSSSKRTDLTRTQTAQRGTKAVVCDGNLGRPAPRAARAMAARPAADAVVTMMTGPASGVESTLRFGRRPQLAVEHDTRQRSLAINRRATVSSGSSARMVPTPTPIASTSARTRWAWRFARADVSAVRRRAPGDAAVEAGRRLQDDERPSFRHQREECLVQCCRRSGTQSHVDHHAGRTKKREASAADQRVRILDRRHDPTNAGFDDVDGRTGRCGQGGNTVRACNRASRRVRASLPRSARGPRRAPRPRARGSPVPPQRHRATPAPRRPADWDWSAQGHARRETARAPCNRDLPLLLEQAVDVFVR